MSSDILPQTEVDSPGDSIITIASSSTEELKLTNETITGPVLGNQSWVETTVDSYEIAETPELPIKSNGFVAVVPPDGDIFQKPSPVIQITPNPSHGTNGKFTLENGIHIVGGEASGTIVKPHVSSTYILASVSASPSSSLTSSSSSINNTYSTSLLPVEDGINFFNTDESNKGIGDNSSDGTEEVSISMKKFSSKFSFATTVLPEEEEGIESSTNSSNYNGVQDLEMESIQTTNAPSTIENDSITGATTNMKSESNQDENHDTTAINSNSEEETKIAATTETSKFILQTTLVPASFFLPHQVEPKTASPILTETETKTGEADEKFEPVLLLSLEQDYYPPASNDGVDINVHDPSKNPNSGSPSTVLKPVNIDLANANSQNQKPSVEIHQEDDSVESFQPGVEWSIDNLYQQTAVGNGDYDSGEKNSNLYQGGTMENSAEDGDSSSMTDDFLNAGGINNILSHSMEESIDKMTQKPLLVSSTTTQRPSLGYEKGDSDATMEEIVRKNSTGEKTHTNQGESIDSIIPAHPTSMGLPPSQKIPVLSLFITSSEEMTVKNVTNRKSEGNIKTAGSMTSFPANHLMENTIDVVQVPEYEILNWCSSAHVYRQRDHNSEYFNYPWLVSKKRRLFSLFRNEKHSNF